METELDLILYGVSLIFLAVFSGALTALEILSLSRFERDADDPDDSGAAIQRLFNDPVVTGISITLARSIWAALVIVFVVRLALDAGLPIDPRLSVAVGVMLSLFVPVAIAKFLAVRDADRFLKVTQPLVVSAAALLRQVAVAISGVLGRISPAVVKLLSFQIIPLKEKIEVLGSTNGGVQYEEQRIMSSVLEFGETRVREVMVPRIDIVAVNAAMDKSEALDIIMDAGHSRTPIYEDTIDNVIGTLYTKDLLQRIASGEDFSMSEIARDTFFVPESKMIDELLSEFRVRRQHLAVVVDEYGGTAGIVTLEDVLEEIVGDIQDEFDAEEALIKRIDEHSVVCNAKMRVEEVNDELGLDLPEEHAESLGGLLYHTIGRVPRVGDRWKHGSVVFEIQSVSGQRIVKVLISGLDPRLDASEDNTG